MVSGGGAMFEYIIENFELIMYIIAGIWGIELFVFVYCLLYGRRRSGKKRKACNEHKEQSLRKNSGKTPLDDMDIIDLDDDDFTFDFL